MTRDMITDEVQDPVIPPEQGCDLTRRSFMQVVGAGILITVTEGGVALGQRRGGGGGRGGAPQRVAARVRINADGTFDVMAGKVEEGQGARAEITMAAAEELRVSPDKIHLIMSDSALVPDDGMTAGSQTTPNTIPAVRQGAAAARGLLAKLAGDQWQVSPDTLQIQNGTITNPATKQTLTYADLAKAKDVAAAFDQTASPGVTVTPVAEWKVLGTAMLRPNSRDLVTGAHQYPSDITRPNMLYGKVLRPPSYKATFESIDLSEVKAIKDVVVVQDGAFIGCAAPSTFRAAEALAAIAKTAKWKTVPQPSSKELYTYLKEHAQRGNANADVEKSLSDASKTVNATYEISYIQHAPMETRAAAAEWTDGKLTVWSSSDHPQGAQRTLAQALGLSLDQVRVIIPDIGGGFGGKHTPEAAEEAARLAKAAGKPVAVHWTRAEEFTWAYSRNAAVIECRAGLDANKSLVAWDFVSINPGGAGLQTPYKIPNASSRAVNTDSPLRQGSYRCLGATANNFARESFMDELAAAAGVDPLEFRLAHLDTNPRIKNVLEAAAKQFDWAARKKKVTPELGVGLACGTEKNSVVAACVEVAIDRRRGQITVKEVCQAFECGPIMNPANLLSQVQGCIMMGLGGALTEEMQFQDGRILNAAFSRYRVPRFADVPKIDVHLVNKPDIPAAGAGETPIIAVAPAIANAVFAATGVRIRSMPIRGGQLPGA